MRTPAWAPSLITRRWADAAGLPDASDTLGPAFEDDLDGAVVVDDDGGGLT